MQQQWRVTGGNFTHCIAAQAGLHVTPTQINQAQPAQIGRLAGLASTSCTASPKHTAATATIQPAPWQHCNPPRSVSLLASGSTFCTSISGSPRTTHRHHCTAPQAGRRRFSRGMAGGRQELHTHWIVPRLRPQGSKWEVVRPSVANAQLLSSVPHTVPHAVPHAAPPMLCPMRCWCCHAVPHHAPAWGPPSVA